MSYINLSKLIKMVLCSALLVLGTGCGLAANNTEPVQGTQYSAQVVKEDKPKEKTIEVKTYGYKEGDKYLQKYATVKNVKQIILVRQSDKIISYGDLFLFTKNPEENWELLLQCQAYLGKNGIDKNREGDRRTPTGDYGFLMAFGAKENPGSIIPYTKLTDTMYLCGDKEYYNQFIDVSKMNHTCSGNSEHLLSYIPQYNYALFWKLPFYYGLHQYSRRKYGKNTKICGYKRTHMYLFHQRMIDHVWTFEKSIARFYNRLLSIFHPIMCLQCCLSNRFNGFCCIN